MGLHVSKHKIALLVSAALTLNTANAAWFCDSTNHWLFWCDKESAVDSSSVGGTSNGTATDTSRKSNAGINTEVEQKKEAAERKESGSEPTSKEGAKIITRDDNSKTIRTGDIKARSVDQSTIGNVSGDAIKGENITVNKGASVKRMDFEDNLLTIELDDGQIVNALIPPPELIEKLKSLDIDALNAIDHEKINAIDTSKISAFSSIDINTLNAIKDIDISSLKGVKGDKGDKGERGLAGNNGRDGRDGKDGKDGEDGSNGENADVTEINESISLLKAEMTGIVDHDHEGIYSPVHSHLFSPLSHHHDDKYSTIHEHIFSALEHNHDGTHSDAIHGHDDQYVLIGHDHDIEYSARSHNHATLHAALDHDHADYSDKTHDHDSDYSLIHDHSYADDIHTHDTWHIHTDYSSVSHDHFYADAEHKHEVDWNDIKERPNENLYALLTDVPMLSSEISHSGIAPFTVEAALDELNKHKFEREFEIGVVTDISTSGFQQINITFNNTFTTKPVIFLTLGQDLTDQSINTGHKSINLLEASNVSLEGFTIIINDSGNSGNVNINWTAISLLP